MALATQCPHCGTTSRVAADQLKLRGGIVRCGACQGVFDGNTALVDLAAAAGASHITPIVLHLRPGVREVFWPWLRTTYPHLVERYRTLYRGSSAPRAYRDAITDFVARQRRRARRRHGQPPHACSPRFAESTKVGRDAAGGGGRGAAREGEDVAEAGSRAHAVEQLRLL